MRTHTSNSDVLIVYDSVRSGKRAKELCDRLGQHRELSLSVWSLSALRLPALARAAAHEAERATLLIVAVNGDETLPRHVKTCLYWCARAIHAADGALVAQLHGILKMNEELCPAYACLKQIAHYSDVRFFSEVLELPDDELPISTGGISGRLTQTQLVATARPARRRGGHTSNKANYAIQPARRHTDHAQDGSCHSHHSLHRWDDAVF